MWLSDKAIIVAFYVLAGLADATHLDYGWVLRTSGLLRQLTHEVNTLRDSELLWVLPSKVYDGAMASVKGVLATTAVATPVASISRHILDNKLATLARHISSTHSKQDASVAFSSSFLLHYGLDFDMKAEDLNYLMLDASKTAEHLYTPGWLRCLSFLWGAGKNDSSERLEGAIRRVLKGHCHHTFKIMPSNIPVLKALDLTADKWLLIKAVMDFYWMQNRYMPPLQGKAGPLFVKIGEGMQLDVNERRVLPQFDHPQHLYFFMFQQLRGMMEGRFDERRSALIWRTRILLLRLVAAISASPGLDDPRPVGLKVPWPRGPREAAKMLIIQPLSASSTAHTSRSSLENERIRALRQSWPLWERHFLVLR